MARSRVDVAHRRYGLAEREPGRDVEEDGHGRQLALPRDGRRAGHQIDAGKAVEPDLLAAMERLTNTLASTPGSSDARLVGLEDH